MDDEYAQFRVFVGGLSWETTDRDLENAFRRFGTVVGAKVMTDRDTGRPRGFGFVTFSDERGMEDAIDKLHNQELDGRVVSVTKAQPKIFSDRGRDYGARGGYGYDNGPKGGYGGGRGDDGGGREDCFNCGRPGHWARECPSGGGGGGGAGRYSSGRFSSSNRYASGSRDRYGSGPAYGSRYDGRDRGGDQGFRDGYSRYADRDGSRGGDRYGGFDRYNGGGGPTRYEGRYRERSGPYERPRSDYDSRY